jgi:hypothetical protein
VPADTRSMDDATLGELREELAALEAAETRISAERRRLHQQIDFGFSTGETRAREREVSDERRRLHRRINSLRRALQPPVPLPSEAKNLNSDEPPSNRWSQWDGISSEVVGADNSYGEVLDR